MQVLKRVSSATSRCRAVEYSSQWEVMTKGKRSSATSANLYFAIFILFIACSSGMGSCRAARTNLPLLTEYTALVLTPLLKSSQSLELSLLHA